MIEESKAFREKEKERRKRQWKRRRDDVSGSLFFCYAIVCACAFHLKKKKEHTLYRAAATRASRKANSALFSSRIRDKKKHSINPENNEKPAVCLYIITQVSRLAPFPLFFFLFGIALLLPFPNALFALSWSASTCRSIIIFPFCTSTGRVRCSPVYVTACHMLCVLFSTFKRKTKKKSKEGGIKTVNGAQQKKKNTNTSTDKKKKKEEVIKTSRRTQKQTQKYAHTDRIPILPFQHHKSV